MGAVVIKDLVKTYAKGTVRAVNGVSFDVSRGELFGLIGPDGAGKTSIFRILTTLLLPDSGTASVDGDDVVTGAQSIRKKVGYMPGRFSLYQDLTVEENIRFFATVFNTTLEKNYHLVRDIYVQIEPFKHRRAGQLSGGMKQKLALCCALIHEPVVLFLDEPTTGVDAVSRKEFWDMLDLLKERGITILVSTPYMDEAARCERIALIQEGSIMSIDTPDGIRKRFHGQLFSVKGDHLPTLLKKLRQEETVATCNTFGDALHVTMKDGRENELTRVLGSLDISNNIKSELIEPNIEDCFIQLMERHGA